jgi:hypothetical protein
MGQPDRRKVDAVLGKVALRQITCMAQVSRKILAVPGERKGWGARMSKSFWLAFAAYVVPTFPLGYVWHLSTFKAHYERLEMYRDPVIIPLGLASMLVQGLVFAWIYPRLFSTVRSDWFGSALLFAATFGLLAWSFTTLPVAAKYRMTSVGTFMALETAFTILQFVVVAPLIALAWRDRV